MKDCYGDLIECDYCDNEATLINNSQDRAFCAECGEDYGLSLYPIEVLEK